MKKLINVITKIGNNPKLMNTFLVDLLTPAEYVEIKRRWEIVNMLHEGIPQHEIAKKLHVGVATVTRGAKALKNSKGGFKKVLK